MIKIFKGFDDKLKKNFSLLSTELRGMISNYISHKSIWTLGNISFLE